MRSRQTAYIENISGSPTIPDVYAVRLFLEPSALLLLARLLQQRILEIFGAALAGCAAGLAFYIQDIVR